MTDKQLLKMIREKLESQGTTFSEYYGGDLAHNSGPRPEEFFKYLNEGNYHVYLLRIPKDFYIKTIDMEQVNKFLGDN